jgi:hypothetical protein
MYPTVLNVVKNVFISMKSRAEQNVDRGFPADCELILDGEPCMEEQ